MSQTLSPYAYPLREVNHKLVWLVDPFTGELRYDILSCDSATCSRSTCRFRAFNKRIQALRYVLRNRSARLITLTKFEDVKTADLFADLLKKRLRKAGHTAELYLAVEPHTQGLLHAHLYLVSEAPDDLIVELFREHVAPLLTLTSWSQLHISHTPSAKSAGYLVKEAEAYIARHLELNGGRLHRKSTPGFFRWAAARSMAGCIKAERRRSRAFRAIESVVGIGKAEDLAAPIAEAHILGALAALLLIKVQLPMKLAHLRVVPSLFGSLAFIHTVRSLTIWYPMKIP
ncbi:hypothetical protein [Glutamicibacter ardleyensis]|uniref:hypothetical protein n=1 Tax=Glutamicibacter ardleyensis TaxID=225894 RepID=UPI003FD29D4E